MQQVIATDLNPRALACAQENIQRLELPAIELQQADLFPTEQPLANLIVCNPPWLPAKPRLAIGIRRLRPEKRHAAGLFTRR